MSPSFVDLLMLAASVGLIGGVVYLCRWAVRGQRRPEPARAVAPKPCFTKGHAYRPVSVGWRCTTCHDTVLARAAAAPEPRVPVGASTR